MQASNAVTPPGAASSRQQQATPPAAGNAGASQPLLYQACRDGDAATVKRLLTAGGIAINAIDPDTRLTPLMLAAWHGHDDVVFMLTKAGQSADVQLQNSRGDSALSLAAGAGKDDVIELLLFKKAQPDQANHSGRMPLAEASAGGHLKAARLLIANGAQVNAGAGMGEPALTVAAQRGDSALVELLLEKKAGTDVTDRYGWTAFNHAAGRGHAAVAQQLRGNGAIAGHEANAAQDAPTASPQQPGPAAVPPPAPQASIAARAESGNPAPQGSTRTTAMTDTTTTTVVVTSPAYAAPSLSAAPAGSAATVLASLRKAVERNDREALNQIITAHPDERAVLNQPIAFTRQRGPLPAGSYTLLMLAAAHGHGPMVEALLALEADVNARSSAEKTALILAVDNRQLDVVEILLKAGADVDAQTADGSTAVTLALARRDPVAVSVLLQGVGDAGDVSRCLRQAAASGHVNTVRLLLKAGADVNGFDDVEGKKKGIPRYEDIQNAHLRGDAFYQQRCQEARRYYDHNGAWNPFVAKEWADSLALFRAARNGHAATVQALVDAGAKVDGDYYGRCLMSEVMTKGHVEIMYILLAARYSAQWRDHDSVPPELVEVLSWAIRTNRPALLRDLLDSRVGKAAAWNSPQLLANAIETDRPGMVRMLLDAGAGPNQQDSHKRHMLIAAAIGSAGAEVMTMLLDAGASLDEACRSSETSPLAVAAMFNSADVVGLLLARLVKAPDAKKHLDAALWSACTGVYRKGERVEIAQMLLDAGAEFNGSNGNNGNIHNLLYQVVQNSRDAQLPQGGSESGDVPRGRAAIVQLLLRHKADVNHDPGKEGHYPSPLFAAACTGATAIVRLLLAAGAKHDLKDKDGRTPLQHAIRNEYKEVEALLRNCNPKLS